MTRLDPEAGLILARDRTDRFRAEAGAERVAGVRRDRGATAGWEGRPAQRPASERILALAARVRPLRRDGSPASR